MDPKNSKIEPCGAKESILSGRVIENKSQFDLIDGKGNAIVFSAIGRNAVNRCLLSGVEMVVYNGTGRNSLGSADGGVCLLKDGMIVPYGKRGSQTKKVRTLVV